MRPRYDFRAKIETTSPKALMHDALVCLGDRTRLPKLMPSQHNELLLVTHRALKRFKKLEVVTPAEYDELSQNLQLVLNATNQEMKEQLEQQNHEQIAWLGAKRVTVQNCLLLLAQCCPDQIRKICCITKEPILNESPFVLLSGDYISIAGMSKLVSELELKKNTAATEENEDKSASREYCIIKAYLSESIDSYKIMPRDIHRLELYLLQNAEFFRIYSTMEKLYLGFVILNAVVVLPAMPAIGFTLLCLSLGAGLLRNTFIEKQRTIDRKENDSKISELRSKIRSPLLVLNNGLLCSSYPQLLRANEHVNASWCRFNFNWGAFRSSPPAPSALSSIPASALGRPSSS